MNDGGRTRSADVPAIDLKRLRAETGIGHIDHHARIESTNTRALELAPLGDFPRPILVIAEEQTAGRGRGTNQWHSAGGSLTFSVLLDTCSQPASTAPGKIHLPPAVWPQASLITGLAVGEALSRFVSDRAIGLKWPNDVFLDGRKVCGILVETTPQAPGHIILGIGINVNNSLENAPEDVRLRGVSMREIAGRLLDRNDVLIQILQQILLLLPLVPADGAKLLSAWRRRCVLTGKQVSLRTGPRLAEGRCEGIDEEGALVIQSSQGIERFFAGVVEQFET